MPKTLRFARLLALGALVFALSGLGLWAQSTSTITGTVKDASGAVIPGAEVTITHTGTGKVRTALTNDAGLFRVPNLEPGHYSVKASLTGFKTAVSEVTVTTLEVASVALVLEVGEVSEVVNVEGAAAVVDTEQGRVSGLVDEKRIVDLPLNGRNIYQLMQLTPGAVNSAATIFEPGQNTNVNGGRANMNGFWMDGVTTKGLSGGTGAGDTGGTTPNLEAIQEFRVETLNFSAEFGDTVGSVVNVVSKAGTNQFHGSGFEFLRNDNLDGREFFDAKKPEFKQNQFGFAVGGPIIKDQTFFFASYEGTRIRTGESSIATFESPQWAQFAANRGQPVAKFLYSNFAAGQTNLSNSVSVGQYLVDFGYISTPDQASVDSFLASTFGASAGELDANAPMIGDASFFTPDSTDNNGWSLRIDEEIGDNDKIFGRYFYNQSVGQSVVARPAFNSPSVSKAFLFSTNWTKIISPTMVNEARFGFTRNVGDIFAGTPGVPRVTDAGSGTEVFGAYNGYPQLFHENIFTYGDTFSITHGNHGMKMGASIRRNQENSEFNVGRPSYYFFDLVYLALDDPYYQIGGVDPKFDQGPGHAELASNFRGWRGTEIGIFFNDDWKVRPNLTLNLGIRWDWYSRLTEVNNRATAFDLTRGGNDIFQRVASGGFIGPVDKLSANDNNNFAPRLGFAWDPFGDGKTSVRGGAGIAYQSGIFNPLANSRWNKPFYSFNLICDVCGRPGEVILYGPQGGQSVTASGANPNPGASTFEGNIIAYFQNNPNRAFLSGIPNPNMRDPYVISFFFGIQREVMRDSTLEINYVGTLGRKLIRAENFNRFPGDRLGFPSPANGAFAGDPAFNRINPNEGVLRFWENSVNSNYNSLQVSFNRRYSHGLALNVNYTWAKSLDTRSTWHSGATSANRQQEGFSTDVFNVKADYGRSIFDARHRFVINWLWDLPWGRNSDSAFVRNVLGGWQLNGITSIQSGQPFTPFCSRSFPGGCDFNADGNNNDRPNTPAGGNSNDTGRDQFANPGGVFGISGSLSDKLAFFGVPTPGTLGTLGRNTFEGPGFVNADFSIFKEVGLPQLGEQGKIQFRAEFFNLFNRPNFLQPEPRLDRNTFGRSTSSFDAREIQLALKILF